MSNLFSIGSPLAEVVGWFIFIASFLIVFSPFIYLGYRKWKKKLPISWLAIILSYLFSFTIYWALEWNLVFLIDDILRESYRNSWWLRDAMSDSEARMFFCVIFAWPLTVFYVFKIKFEHLTLKSFFLSTIIAMVIFIALAGLAAYLIAWGLGQLANSL